jgi:hypothetical protein
MNNVNEFNAVTGEEIKRPLTDEELEQKRIDDQVLEQLKLSRESS